MSNILNNLDKCVSEVDKINLAELQEPFHNDEIFRSPVVWGVLGYALYDKEHIFALFRSNVHERSTMLGEAIWILKRAHSTFGIVTNLI